MGAKLFVIDGSPAVRRMVEQVSATEGYEVHTFQDGPTALQAAKQHAPKTIIADFHLDKITFSSFCKELGKIENMSEASIISLVDSSDKIDESVYKSLGVAVFLTKPLEPGNLLDTLKSLAEKRAKKGAKAKTKRTWPPVTTSTDDEEDEDMGAKGPVEELEFTLPPAKAPSASAPAHHESKPSAASGPAPVPTASVGSRASAPPATASAQAAPAQLESASKTLIDAMAAGVIPQVTQAIMGSLPGLIAKEVESALSSRLEDTVQKHVAQTLSNAKITETVEMVMRKELPGLMAAQMASHVVSIETALDTKLSSKLESMAKPLIERASQETLGGGVEAQVEKQLPKVVRDHVGSIDRLVMNTVQDLAAPQIREALEKQMQEGVPQQVAKAVRDQVGSIDRLVLNTVQDLAAPQLHEAIEKTVRESAQDQIARAVREIVPAVAETQVSEEIKRLSALA